MSNMMPGDDLITFAIGAPGAMPATVTINPAFGPLPAITGGLVTIDGTSQAPPLAFQPYIELFGNGTAGNGLTVGGAGRAIISGLAINSFTGAGIALNNPTGSLGSIVTGCFIGTSFLGTETGLGNTGNGITITGPNNTIGDATSTIKMVIAGNGGVGVEINGGTQNVVQNCYIGVDSSGQTKLANVDSGIFISGSNNTIGGAGNLTNVISGNGKHGVRLAGNGNKLLGNYIGVTNTGLAAQGNTQNGVYIADMATSNEITGFNVISANGHNGVMLSGTSAAGNKVYGAYIGTNKDGTAALANLQRGVKIDNAQSNDIGGTGASQGNVISGNNDDGIGILGTNARFNKVIRNYIGLTKNGNAKLGNGGDGIEITGSNNTIGAGGENVWNVISGNTNHGVHIHHGTFNVVVNNRIGTDKDGEVKLGNQGSGVYLGDQAHDNTIGGTQYADTRNVISGNEGSGVDIRGVVAAGTDAMRNTIAGNYIGLNKTGLLPLGNTTSGVYIQRASQNWVGGTTVASQNVISANQEFGVDLSVGATSNTVKHNIIGKKADGTAGPANVLGSRRDVTGLNTWENNDEA